MFFRYNLKFSASTAPSEVDKAENDREADVESVESQEDEEEKEEFVEAVEDITDLNASQRKELMEILRKVEETNEGGQPDKIQDINGEVAEADISS